MIFADEIRSTILKLAAERGPERTFQLTDVAQALDQKDWRELIDRVKFVSNVLIHEGKIIARNSSDNSQSELSMPRVDKS
jgi:hypothetical protein